MCGGLCAQPFAKWNGCGGEISIAWGMAAAKYSIGRERASGISRRSMPKT